MDFIADVEKAARALPFGSPPIVVGHPLIGRIGYAVPGRGFRICGMSSRSLNALLKDERRAQRALRELGAITTWDGILAARAGGKADDRFASKNSQTTVSTNWSGFFRSGGIPAAGAYTNIPGGSDFNHTSTGAVGFTDPTGGDKKYLINFGANHLSGSNVVLLVDLLVAAGNILATVNTLQTVNTTALTRYTDGEGVMIILEVTTAIGTTASNVTLTYTNQAGTGSRSTGAIAMTVSAITFRLLPAGSPFMVLASGDRGVRSVEGAQLSAAMTAGVMAVLLFKPLLFIPTLASTAVIERSTPGMLGGLLEMPITSGGNVGCLTFLILTNTTSTGQQTYHFQTAMG